jgi:hypothetical protein
VRGERTEERCEVHAAAVDNLPTAATAGWLDSTDENRGFVEKSSGFYCWNTMLITFSVCGPEAYRVHPRAATKE